MKDELTEEMHAEFTIDAETDLKHTCWAVYRCIERGMSLATAIDVYEIEMKDLEKNLDEYNKLMSKNIFLK